jgi:hypothetical protein
MSYAFIVNVRILFTEHVPVLAVCLVRYLGTLNILYMRCRHYVPWVDTLPVLTIEVV